MINKKIVGAAVVLVILAGVWLYLYSNPNISYSPQATPSPTPTVPTHDNTLKSETATVTYTDSGFSPSPTTISKGTTVVFKNGSSEAMWVASGPHPAHNAYPTTGGCIASTFDSCTGIAPGGSWSFTFEIAGTWGYHNHLNVSKFGKVVVQ